VRVEPQRAAEGEQAKRLLQVFLRSMVMLIHLICASAGEEVELNKRVMSLEFGMAVMQMTSVL
jgi:hypothetical protein